MKEKRITCEDREVIVEWDKNREILGTPIVLTIFIPWKGSAETAWPTRGEARRIAKALLALANEPKEE